MRSLKWGLIAMVVVAIPQPVFAQSVAVAVRLDHEGLNQAWNTTLGLLSSAHRENALRKLCKHLPNYLPAWRFEPAKEGEASFPRLEIALHQKDGAIGEDVHMTIALYVAEGLGSSSLVDNVFLFKPGDFADLLGNAWDTEALPWLVDSIQKRLNDPRQGMTEQKWDEIRDKFCKVYVSSGALELTGTKALLPLAYERFAAWAHSQFRFECNPTEIKVKAKNSIHIFSEGALENGRVIASLQKVKVDDAAEVPADMYADLDKCTRGILYIRKLVWKFVPARNLPGVTRS